jgi:lysyl-tRNA synthetase class 2
VTAVDDAPPAQAEAAVEPGPRAPPPRPAPLAPDLIEVAVPRGGRAVVVSDLHLSNPPTDASRNCASELATVLDRWDGPGVLVIAGDGFELLAGPNPNIHLVLDAHADFAGRVRAFAAGADHRVVVLSGNHDGPIAWDPDIVATLRGRLGVTDIAIAADLVFDTGDGAQKVHVVHGNQDDHYNAFIDVRSPIDTPMGHHVVRDVLPELERADKPGGLLEGVPWLNDTSQITEMVASRLLYRKVGNRLWWLAAPFLAAVALRLVTFLPGVDRLLRHHAERWLIGLGIALVLVLVVAALATTLTMLRVHHALSDELTTHTGTASHNAAARERAARMITGGYAGMISGHTHDPELSVVGTGFYANSGCGVVTVGPSPARFGLPRPFLAFRRCSRVELGAYDLLEVRLVVGDTPVRPSSRMEQLVARPVTDVPATPQVVASLPGGATWPTDPGRLGSWVRRRRVRRIAAALLVAAGVLNVVTALLPTLSQRLDDVERVVPVHVPRAASVLAILGGLAMIGLARPLRRGYRPAFTTTLLVLAVVVFTQVLRSLNWEQAVLTAALALWLLTERRHFRVEPTGHRRWAAWGVSLAVGAVLLAAGLAVAFDRPERLTRDVIAFAVGAMVLLAVFTAGANRGDRVSATDRAADLERARAVVREYGGDTLDYFALGEDKEILFSGEGIVAYTVVDRTMLVSPDPIGPPEERAEMWADAMDHADRNGWGVTVLAASAGWLPTYHDAGLHDLYIGDEAIVDCQTFSLQGPAMESLRAAHNRLAQAGHRVEVVDPLSVDTALQATLRTLMAEPPERDAERRFSMTLGRLFDPADTGLLLAICFDAGGTPLAFDQYVPARAVGGYSLDMVHVAAGPDGPDELTEFIILETIDWMRQRGMRGLGLNFATTGAVRAGEEGGGPWRRLEGRTRHPVGDTIRIESVWPFDEKYDPTLRPRYVATDSMLERPAARAVRPRGARSVRESACRGGSPHRPGAT